MLTLLLIPLAGLHFCVLNFVTIYHCNIFQVNFIINLGMGGAKGAQDAAYIYEELIDKYGGSAILLNGLSVAKMNQVSTKYFRI
jgi:hypothetical protein